MLYINGMKHIEQEFKWGIKMWVTKKIGDICSIKRGASPRPIQQFLDKEGIPWVKIADATSSYSRYIETTNQFIKPEGADKSVTVSPGTLILSNSATPGLPKIMKIKACVHDGWLILSDFRDVTRDFLYYMLLNIRKTIINQANGSVFQNLKTDIVRNFDILLPPIEYQQKLVKFLVDIDEKIYVYRQINTNLERQAQAIFKEMFIDNDCNQHGDNYSTFQELISFTSNGYWGQNQPNEKDSIKVVCIRGTDIPNIKLGAKGKIPLRYISYHNYVAKQLKEGDIVIEISGGSPTQSTGRCIVITETLLNRYEAAMICTNFCKLLRPKKKYSMFIYYYLQYFYQNGTFFSYENGTTGIKNLDIMSFLETELIKIPSDNEITIFNQHCNIIFNQIFANGTQIDCLSALRDTLLPKLMSGEIDVSKIELD